MIARLWHGATKPSDADAYEAMLKPELLPGISAVAGYRGSYLLRREGAQQTEFVTIMLWDSLDAIRNFVGENHEASVIPEERRKYLSQHDPTASHYEVVAVHTPPAPVAR